MSRLRFTTLPDLTTVVAQFRTGEALHFATAALAEEAAALVHHTTEYRVRVIVRLVPTLARWPHTTATTAQYFLRLVGRRDTAEHLAELFQYHQGTREVV